MAVSFFEWEPSIEGYRCIILTEDAPSAESGGSDRHEEGWSSWWTGWTLEGDYVIREWSTDGTDCDGRLSRHGRDVCEVEKLHSQTPYGLGSNPPFFLPQWEDKSTWQRDYAAEAAGY